MVKRLLIAYFIGNINLFFSAKNIKIHSFASKL